MAELQLRKWLQKIPHPQMVRAWDADGDEKTVRVGVSRSRWRDAEEALANAVRLEALDNDGNVLRACELDNGHVGPAESKQGKSAGAELAELARIITTSNDAAVLRYVEIVRLAFEQHGQLIGVMSERLQGLERAWGKLVASMPEGENGDDMGDMLAKFVMTQALNGKREKKPPPKPNGASE